MLLHHQGFQVEVDRDRLIQSFKIDLLIVWPVFVILRDHCVIIMVSPILVNVDIKWVHVLDVEQLTTLYEIVQNHFEEKDD